MMIWIVAIGMAAIGGFWIKTRRRRKKAENTYVPN
jgi:LPXTG-motif cell wall-anchored protein